MDNPEIIARVEILKLQSGQQGVRLSALNDFMILPPIQRALLLAAAIQLCGAAIEAIYEDYPDDQDEIRDGINAVMIEPSNKSLN